MKPHLSLTENDRSFAIIAWLLLIMLTSAHELFAQRKPDFAITNATAGSDWFIRLNATGASADMDCWGTDTYSYTIYKNGNVLRTVDPGSISQNQKIVPETGIAIGGSYRIMYKTDGSLFSCHYWKYSNTVTAFTSALKAPKNVTASDSTSESALRNQIKITWQKGTDVPENIHHYRIYKDGDFSAHVAQVTGSVRNWEDVNLGPGEKHTYSIITYVNSTTWGFHTSDTITVEGSTFPGIVASDGTLANGVEITWPDISSAAKSLKIFRNGVEIHSRTDMHITRSYKDNDLVPGLRYVYTLTPYSGETFFTAPLSTFSDTGYARRNGRIHGSVKAPFGGPVEGAIVYAERISSVDQGDQNPTVYSDTTNANGLFDIRDIYYHEEAVFKVYAKKGDHGFNPASYDEILLDQLAPVYTLPSPSFVDTSSFTITGNIMQRINGQEAAAVGVEILVNDQYKGTRTDEQGNFSLTVEEIGQYSIKPRYFEHTFDPPTISVNVEEDVTDLAFEDVQRSTLSGRFLGGCSIYIGQATLRIFNTENPTAGIDVTVVTAAGSGHYEVELPSRAYTIEVIDFVPDESQPDLTKDDIPEYFPLTKVDLTEGSVEKDFVYRKPPEIEIAGLPASGCAPFDVPIVEQIARYNLEIRVFESFGSESCLTSTGYIVVHDEIKDGYNGADTLQLENGIAIYELLPGQPNILSGGEHPYQKKISIHANVDGQTGDVVTWALVEGNKPREQTFTTVAPETPFLILRDPPGDQSYSYLSENTKFTSSMKLYTQLSGSVNVWQQAKLGVEQEAGMGVTIPYKFWGQVKSSMEIGASLKSQAEFGMEFATQNKFSTSGNQDITGEDGDVFIGAAMNMLYALTDVIDYNSETCGVETSQQIIMATDGFATTFMYTENHIRNVLIPQLKDIKKIYEQKQSDSVALYENQISVWEQILERNKTLKEEATFIENKSFSAGAGYESEVTVTATAGISLEFNMYIEQTIATEAGLEVGGSGASLGSEVKYKLELGGSAEAGITHEKKVGYSLNDDDIGDFFSVDIKGDRAYGTPVFKLVSGRSSCPWEKGTQPREGVRLTVDKNVQHNIEHDAAAAFKLNLGNTSQSDETRTYNLVFLQESNPEGAVLTLGGSEVQGGILTPYNIPAGSSVDATVTVKRGPQSNAYQDLKFALLSDCDDGILGDTVAFSVFFKSNCSAVTISKPLQGWIVNSSDNNSLTIELSGSDKDNLNNVVLQYRNVKSEVWESATILSASDLGTEKTSLTWDVTAFDDGEYEIRIKIACGQDNSEYSFSDRVRGTIDRSAPELFGVPAPTDGKYSTGDEISANFNEDINCFNFSPANVIARDITSNEVYDVAVGCSGNKILIVPVTDKTFTDQAMEITLQNIEDVYGNVRPDVITWQFDIENADFEITAATDSDSDGIPNVDDNCPFTANSNQADTDGDGIGDVCDDDIDGDGVPNNIDNCPYFANPDQADADGNGIGDICELSGDGDGDGVPNEIDNCPFTSNANQLDTDNDGIGDVCDDDTDGDGVLNSVDNCPTVKNPGQEDKDGDGAGDACDIVTAIEKVPENALTLRCYPNPAENVVNVIFKIAAPSLVNIRIIDIANRSVKSLANEPFQPGEHVRTFDVSGLNSGLYIIQLTENGVTRTEKLFIQN